MIDIVVIRDPDASNEIQVFGAQEHTHIVDIDLGRADLRDSEEFSEWAESLREDRNRAYNTSTQRYIEQAVRDAAEAFDHLTPVWAL